MTDTGNMHFLEKEYGLTADEILDAVASRFRAKVALESAVAEVQLEKMLVNLQKDGKITKYIRHDEDGYPDFTLFLPDRTDGLLIECKNVRNKDEAFRRGGKIYAYKVETQKTRASKSDKSSRFYDKNLFQILAVCLGKKTGKWNQFIFIRSRDLSSHPDYPSKLAVIHPVPLPESEDKGNWTMDLAVLLKRF